MALQTPVEFSGMARIVIQAHVTVRKPGERDVVPRRRVELAVTVPASRPFAIRIAATVSPS